MQGMLRRAARSARLDKQGFREVVEDEGTVLNALGLVVLSGIAIAVGMVATHPLGCISVSAAIRRR